MKILHVTEAWNGGISTYVNTLLRRQAQSKDIDSIALAHSTNQTDHGFCKDFYEENGVKLYPYQSTRNPLRIISTARQIKAIVADYKPDIIHLHSTFPGFYGRAFRASCPVVYCAHGWSFAQESGTAKKAVYAAVERMLAKRTAFIINISQHEQDAADRAGIKARQSRVIYNGIRDTDLSKQAPALEIDAQKINIGFIGRLDDKKGFDIAAEIFSRPEHSQNVMLYVIGEACRDDQEKVESPAIKYLGWIDHDLIDDYISQFDAALIPSRQEGFGLVAAEAMRNAKPVIASRAGALPELIKDGENGYVFDLADYKTRLPEILNNLNKDTLASLGQNARQSYEKNFTDTRFADDILQCYRDVLAAAA